MNDLKISLNVPNHQRPTFILFLRLVMFIAYLALILLAIVIAQTAAPLWALLLMYWVVVDNINTLLPIDQKS